ncbi:MAG: response regulator [Chloroflexi bacterium]|nr:response regulator [Chloroflexota bacterium]
MIKRTEELNNSIIEGIRHALVVLDESLRIVKCNRQFQDVFQLASDVEPGVNLMDVLPESRLEAIIKQSMTANKSTHEVEFDCYIGDDEERHFLLAVSIIKLSSSENGALVIFDEITEWKRRQFQVMEASRLVSVGEMAAGIAHEINNPLAAVMGFSQLVLRRDVEESVRNDLNKILAEAKRASKIIANLQSFARRYKPRKEYVSVADIVQKILDFRSYELQVNNIEVVTRFDSKIPYVLGDEHQLEQVFLNIVTNAEQFMSSAHGEGTLTVTIESIDEKILISFSDDGPGIKKDDLPKIFDPFFTTKDVGSGTGLGLSICYGMIHEHDGTITVESIYGQGATVIIELPMPEMPSPRPADQESPIATLPPEKMRVLVVDDEPLIAECLSRALSDEGHLVELAKTGSELIENRDLTRYDIIILDVKMPGIDGMELFDHIKQLSGDVSSRVMFITGDISNPATREFITSTGNPMIAKPFTLDGLVSAVRKFAMKQSRKSVV